MDLGAFFLLFLVFVVVVLFIAWPFVKQLRVNEESGYEFSSLLAERDRVLNAIQELDFDNSLGKIPADEYPVQRASLLQRGAEILRQLDALSPIPSLVKEKSDGGEEPTQRHLEEAKSTHESEPSPEQVRLITDDDLEELIAKRRSARKGRVSGFCPKCGKPIMQSDQFCPSCGQALGSNQ